jgi:hypothetical protein
LPVVYSWPVIPKIKATGTNTAIGQGPGEDPAPEPGRFGNGALLPRARYSANPDGLKGLLLRGALG